MIIETLLLNKNIHKATLISARNHIDHLLINRQWIYSVIVTKVQREADANSDHYLMNARVWLRLSTYTNKLNPRVDVQRLQNKN